MRMRKSIKKRLYSCAALVAAGMLSLAASASAPAGQYTIANGTVYDTRTKLTWQQTPSSTGYTWTDAKGYCAGLGTTLGGSGWRVPTVKELATLVDYSRASPTIDSTAFPSFPALDYWTTTVSGATSGIYVVEFRRGFILAYLANSTLRRVLCVR
jgi:hypothetical protein